MSRRVPTKCSVGDAIPILGSAVGDGQREGVAANAPDILIMHMSVPQDVAVGQAHILVVGPPSLVRDQYELAFRRHHADVLVTDDFRLADWHMRNTGVHAVVVAAPAADAQLEEFLHAIRGAWPSVPVFFSGSQEPSDAAHLLDQSEMILMPPTASVESLEQLLFPLVYDRAITEGADETPVREETLLLHRREFSIEFRIAKAEFEREFFLRSLERDRGNVSLTSRVARVARRNLQLKIQAHGINLDALRGRVRPAKQHPPAYGTSKRSR